MDPSVPLLQTGTAIEEIDEFWSMEMETTYFSRKQNEQHFWVCKKYGALSKIILDLKNILLMCMSNLK